MARYSKTLWDTLTIYNPTNMNHIEQGIYDADLREGGTIDGGLQIHGNTLIENNGTTDSYLLVGGSTSRGLERIYKSGHYTQIYHQNNLTANRELYLPDKTGTIALTSDLSKSGFTGIDVPADGSSTTQVTFANPFPQGTSYSVNVTQSGTFAYVDVFLGSTDRTPSGFKITVSSTRSQALTNLNIMWTATPLNS